MDPAVEPSSNSSLWTKTKNACHRASKELGFHPLIHSSRDVHIVILLRTLRTFCFGIVGLIFALYFSELGISDSRIGLFMTLTQIGDVLLSLVLTFVADGLGRRRTLLLGSLLMVLAGITFANTTNYWILLPAAIAGIISPSGNEMGPFRAIEESTLAHLTVPEKRSEIFAWYVVLSTFTGAIGLNAAGWLVDSLRTLQGWTEVDAYRAMFWIYTAVGVLNAVLTLFLSKACEIHSAKLESDGSIQSLDEPDQDETAPLLSSQNGVPVPPSLSPKTYRSPITRETLPLLIKLCILFSIDSLASGIMPWSLLNYYMDQKFSLRNSTLGTIMSVAWFCSAGGSIFASSIAKRIGLIRTMVFTHLPAAIFLGLIPIPRSLSVTIALIYARATLNSMDQAPRSAFLAEIVSGRERTAVMGSVNVVKTLSQSGGPTLTGFLAQSKRFWIAFVLAGALKAAYDLGLLVLFLERGVSGKGNEEEENGVGHNRGIEQDEDEGYRSDD